MQFCRDYAMKRITKVLQAHAVFRVFLVSFDTLTKFCLHLFIQVFPSCRRYELNNTGQNSSFIIVRYAIHVWRSSSRFCWRNLSYILWSISIARSTFARYQEETVFFSTNLCSITWCKMFLLFPRILASNSLYQLCLIKDWQRSLPTKGNRSLKYCQNN